MRSASVTRVTESDVRRYARGMAGEETVVDELLERQANTLTPLLRWVADKVELRVRATYLPEVLVRDSVEADPSILRLRDRLRHRKGASQYEQIRLGEKVAAAV